MFLEFALEHTWLIPLLPALAFPIIGLVTRQWRILSAGIALTAIFASFLLAAGTALAVVCFNITVENPFTQHFEWVTIGSMHLQLGTLIDPLTAMMLVVVTLVSLLVEIYSSAYMADDPGYGRFFCLYLFVCRFNAGAGDCCKLYPDVYLLGIGRSLFVSLNRFLLL